MRTSQEELVEEKRRGFVTGLAVSELMLLILFALLLFLVEGKDSSEDNREVVDNFGGKGIARGVGEAIGKSPEIQRILREDPNVIDLWITLTTSGALSDTPGEKEVMEGLVNKVAELERAQEELEVEIDAREEEAAELNGRLTAANIALMEGVRKGGTTLCTYSSPSIDYPRPRSLPLGVVLLENEGITLLSSGYESETLIDAYGEPFDSKEAVEIVSAWELRSRITFDQFEDINSELITLGDEYANDTRQNCRYYFDYYFENIDADNLDLWNRLNYSGVKLSSDRFAELQ